MFGLNFLYKTIFSFILFLPFFSFPQTVNRYSKENFLEQLNKDFNSFGVQVTEKELFENTRQNFINKIKEESKGYYIEIINYSRANGQDELLSFLYYTNWLLNNNIKASSSIEKILMYHYYDLYNPTENNTNYFLSLWDIITNKVLANETSFTLKVKDNFKVGVEDFLDFGLYDNTGNILGTLVFSFLSTDILITSEFHNFKIEKPNFNYFPDVSVIDGVKGKVTSNIPNKYLGEVDFLLQNFTIDLKSGKLVSNESVLSSNKLKGIKDPIDVYMVGISIESLQPPGNTDKVKKIAGPKKIKSRARDRKIKEWFWYIYPKLGLISFIYLITVFWPMLSRDSTRRSLNIDNYFFWVDYVNVLINFVYLCYENTIGKLF